MAKHDCLNYVKWSTKILILFTSGDSRCVDGLRPFYLRTVRNLYRQG